MATQAPQAQQRRYEYKVMMSAARDPDLERKLSELGKDGWLLVGGAAKAAESVTWVFVKDVTPPRA